MEDRHYFDLLAKDYPTVEAISSEIINLSAICQLPKGTEYFFSDVHGEADAFAYLLGTASGVIYEKIKAIFQNALSEPERMLLSELIYRPKEVLDVRRRAGHSRDWCRVTIFRLVQVCKSVASKYTRSKVRKKMPPHYAYIMDELLHTDIDEKKDEYYTAIIEAIDATGIAEDFIVELCGLIRRCAVNQLHIIGDIFDRGPHADLVMDELMRYTDVDIQWGNHDIHWMGAAAGNAACVASVLRVAISYNNFDLLEDGYGINLRPLSAFAAEVYRDDPCELFLPHLLDNNLYDPIDEQLAAKMHKAIAIIQFKLEGQLVARHPEYGMESRSLLTAVDYATGEVTVNGKRYPLRDTLFPTVNPADPLALTRGEEELVRALTRSFTHSPQLARHIRYLYNNGSLYKIVNGNLLYHGGIPMEKDGSFTEVNFGGKTLSGRALLDAMDATARDAYFDPPGSESRENAGDFLWYLWCGRSSPVFAKDRMATFERYFLTDKTAQKEQPNPYYALVEDPETGRDACERILREFGLDSARSRIVNGHVPVKQTAGESPIKGGGLLFVIDGGISKAYHSKTGIGGYTLISDSHALSLAQHLPFAESRNEAFGQAPKVQIVERFPHRVSVRETDTGALLTRTIAELKELLAAYRDGEFAENRSQGDF